MHVFTKIVIRLWLKTTAYRFSLLQMVKLQLNQLKIENSSIMYFSEFSDLVVKETFNTNLISAVSILSTPSVER